MFLKAIFAIILFVCIVSENENALISYMPKVKSYDLL